MQLRGLVMDLEQVNLQNHPNVFIDFEIILKSKKQDIVRELDVLITMEKLIYLWSKKYSPQEMISYCNKIIIDEITEEKELHKKVIEMRKERKTYTEISDELGIKPERIGYFLSVDVNKVWKLTDWIKDFYVKDSAFYDKVDILIDPDENIVNRFLKRGKYARLADKI